MLSARNKLPREVRCLPKYFWLNSCASRATRCNHPNSRSVRRPPNSVAKSRSKRVSCITSRYFQSSESLRSRVGYPSAANTTGFTISTTRLGKVVRSSRSLASYFSTVSITPVSQSSRTRSIAWDPPSLQLFSHLHRLRQAIVDVDVTIASRPADRKHVWRHQINVLLRLCPLRLHRHRVMLAVHGRQLDPDQCRRRLVLRELLVLHQSLHPFRAAVVQEKNVVRKTLFDGQDHRMKIQAHKAQRAEAVLEQGVGSDGIDDHVERLPLPRQLDPLLRNVVLLRLRREQDARLCGGNVEIIVVTVGRIWIGRDGVVETLPRALVKQGAF